MASACIFAALDRQAHRKRCEPLVARLGRPSLDFNVSDPRRGKQLQTYPSPTAMADSMEGVEFTTDNKDTERIVDGQC